MKKIGKKRTKPFARIRSFVPQRSSHPHCSRRWWSSKRTPSPRVHPKIWCSCPRRNMGTTTTTSNLEIWSMFPDRGVTDTDAVRAYISEGTTILSDVPNFVWPTNRRVRRRNKCSLLCVYEADNRLGKFEGFFAPGSMRMGWDGDWVSFHCNLWSENSVDLWNCREERRSWESLMLSLEFLVTKGFSFH